MNNQEHKLLIKLCKNGINAIKISETSDKTADFFVEEEDKNYLIEYKIRQDNLLFQKELKSNGYADQCTKAAKTDNVYQILRDAKTQLVSSGKKYDVKFNVIWVELLTSDNENSLTQFYSTAYGCQDLLTFEKPPRNFVKCFYYNESFFYRYKGIVAIVIEYNSKFTCLLNEYSPDCNCFCDSKLGLLLMKGITKPIEENNNERLLIADCDINRKNKRELINYLNNKYSIRIKSEIDFHHFHGRIGM